jgi:type I restriction enzyme S subunit
MKLRFLSDIKKSGKSCKPYDGERIYIDTGSVQWDSIVSGEPCTYEKKPSRANICVQVGDVLFAKMQGSIKVLEITEENADNIYSTGFYCFRDERVSPSYLKYLFLSPIFNTLKDNKSHGSTMSSVNDDNIKRIVIDIPDLNEQAKIVERLDTISQAICCQKQLLQLLDELIESGFIEMFGDPIENPHNWEMKELGEECDIITGNTPSREIESYYGDYIEWIKSDNINTPSALLTQAKEYLSEDGLKVGRCVDEGAILMTCIAGSKKCIGNVAIADRKVSFNQQINAIVPNSNSTWFLYVLFILAKETIQAPISMSLKGIISKGKLSKMRFIFPPYELQMEYEQFVKEVLKYKKQVSMKLEYYYELLNIKMDECFLAEVQ